MDPYAGMRPMLAVGGQPRPGPQGWQHEVKWDGVRALVSCAGQARVRSRSGRDCSVAYPELAAVGGGRDLLLDAEIVALDPVSGAPDFGRVQSRLGVTRAADAARLAATTPVVLLVFDLLARDGELLVERPLEARRELLEQLELASPVCQVPPAFDGPIEQLLAVSAAQGLEGVLSKRLGSPYRPGERHPDWRKFKHSRRQEVVVCGWEPGDAGRAEHLGALVLGVHVDGRLSYAGKVGTGFTDQVRQMLAAELASRAQPASPFDDGPPQEQARRSRWIRPDLVVEVEFTGWTREGRMRHPSFKGVRRDADAAAVVREP